MESQFNNFLKNFVSINKYLIQNVKYNILINSSQEPYIVTDFLEKINIIVRNECQLIDDNFELFVFESNEIWIIMIYEDEDGFCEVNLVY